MSKDDSPGCLVYHTVKKNHNDEDQKSELFGRVGQTRALKTGLVDENFGRGNPSPTCLSAPTRLQIGICTVEEKRLY